MLLSGHLCSFLKGWLYTPCNIMVLLKLGTHVVAWTGRVIQCTVTACTLLWLVAIRNTADIFGGSMLFKLGRGSTRLTECSWADNLHLSWQLSWQVAAKLTAELTNCSWADSWVHKLPAELTAELTICSWADTLHVSWELSWQLEIELSWQIAAELPDCSQADTLRLK